MVKKEHTVRDNSPERASSMEAQRGAMEKLKWLVGDWEGESWIETRTGRSVSISKERVQDKLGGLMLLIEGLHFRKMPDGTQGPISLNAIALVTYDDQNEQYRFNSYTQDGQSGDFDATIVDKKFVWTMQMPGRTTRYTIEQTPESHWFEIGESSVDGKQWNKFFEMNLQKTN